jgi:hypothetical protein
LLPVAEVEEVLQAGTQQLHHHDVELSLCAVVLYLGYPHPTLHHLHTKQIYLRGYSLDITTRISGPNTLYKKFAVFLSPAGMSLTKPSLAGNNLIIPVLGDFGK